MSICIVSNQPFVPGKIFQLLFEKAGSRVYALFRIHELIFLEYWKDMGFMKVVFRYEDILGFWDLALQSIVLKSDYDVGEGERFRTEKKKFGGKSVVRRGFRDAFKRGP
jgi:hypothetical protein